MMAIKKRQPIDQARLEAFAAGADAPPQQVVRPPAHSEPAEAPRTTTVGEWTPRVPRTFLLRWNDDTLPRELAEIAAREDRSQHKIALKAMRLGLEALRNEQS